MNNFIIYSLELAISLAVFYSAYWLFLKRETFFKLNRFYLLFSVTLSLLIPLLNITISSDIGNDSFLTRYLTVPIAQFEQNVFGMDAKNFQADAQLLVSKRDADKESRRTGKGHSINKAKSDPSQTIVSNMAPTTNVDKKIGWQTFAFVVYLIGVMLVLIRFIANFIRIYAYALRCKAQDMFGVKVIRIEKNNSPFSFLHLIFISQVEYPEDELIKIISHEKMHIQQKHSIDLIVMELILAIQWFNPFVWLYKRAIKINHEYLADQGTLKSGIDLPGYQYSLLNQVLRENDFEIASNYNLTIKKRIAMMTKKRSNKFAALKLIIALPIVSILFSAFACTTNDSDKSVRSERQEENKMTSTDTLIKEQKISIDYLKLVAGEYISEGPHGGRKIQFVEVQGALFACDGGYRYKLIPVGDEKFINPDDGVSLVFNSKNKSEITLLLDKKINLKKAAASTELVDFPKKSVAYSLADVITKDGITAALSKYQEIKKSDKYELNEWEMYFAGEQLLKVGKANEAAAFLKLAIEAFPNSFKAYAYYADALLAQGDKTQAIENYKKSVRLNPGYENARTKLNDLGIDPNTVVKKVTVTAEYLKLLEGDYFSNNESWGITRIEFSEENGVLFAKHNNYGFKLLPVGEEKFINVDDAASFVFNSKNKNAITLSVFGISPSGAVNLEKLNAPKGKETTVADVIKKVNVPVDYLKLLVGEYVSTNDPNGERKIIFTEEKGELVGKDADYRYKLIPVGDGKFINPDDGAKLVFDTKNKNAINLLLFGRINLKKIK